MTADYPLAMFWRGVVLAVIVVVGAGACSDPQAKPVTEAEARSVLAKAVELGLAGKDGELCDMAEAQLLCEGILDRARGRRPVEPPVVVGKRMVRSEGDTVGGMVLELEGIDGTGKPYRGEILVSNIGDGPCLQMPVWWSGISVGG